MKRSFYILIAASALIVAAVATAGDDAVEIITFPASNDGGIQAGVHACTSQPYYKRNLAVQCIGGTGVYVRPASTNTGDEYARVTDVYVATGKLYDSPTTGDKQHICLRAVDGGAPTSCTILIHRERGE